MKSELKPPSVEQTQDANPTMELDISNNSPQPGKANLDQVFNQFESKVKTTIHSPLAKV